MKLRIISESLSSELLKEAIEEVKAMVSREDWKIKKIFNKNPEQVVGMRIKNLIYYTQLTKDTFVVKIKKIKRESERGN